jgi:hypothetical protein
MPSACHSRGELSSQGSDPIVSGLLGAGGCDAMAALLLYVYGALAAAASVVLVARGRARGLAYGTLAWMVAGHVLAAVLLLVGAVAWLFNGYAGGECCERWNTLGFAIPTVVAGVAVSLAAWLPVLRRLR